MSPSLRQLPRALASLGSVLIAHLLLGAPALAASAPPYGQWEELATPAPRIEHISLYDPTRDRMLVFGGHPNDAWIFQFGSPGSWTRFLSPAGGPANFDDAQGVWDTNRNRALIVFLARQPSQAPQTAQVYALDFDPTPHWSLLATSGPYPSYRTRESVCYDAVRDRLVVFGGGSPDGYGGFYEVLNDVWELPLGGSQPFPWHNITPSGALPPARLNHAATIDLVQDRLIVFGGAMGNQYGSDTYVDCWALPLAGSSPWTQLPDLTIDFFGHSEATATFDPVGNRMIVAGGAELGSPEAPFVVGGAYQLSFAGPTPTWTRVVGGQAVDRFAHSAILRTATHEVVVFGGAFEFESHRSNELWALSLDGTPHWELRSPTTGPPEERMGQTAVYDPRRDRMVVYGGWNGVPYCDYIYCPMQYFADVWHLDLNGGARWHERVVDQSGRSDHSAIVDAARDRMIAFGGRDATYGFVKLNNVLALPLNDSGNWTVMQPLGTLPAPRDRHSAIYDPLRDRMIVFGGSTFMYGDLPNNETWQLSLADPMTWTQLAPAGSPPARGGHAAIYDPVRDRMLVLGGSQAQVWGLTFQPSLTWQPLTTAGQVPPLFGAEMAAIYDPIGDRILTFSGRTSIVVWSLDLSASPPTWTQWTPSGSPPPPGVDYCAVYDSHSDRVLLLGADVSPIASNRTWALELGRPVPAVAALVSAEATADGARIVWSLGEAGARATVEKRSEISAWSVAGELLADGSGLALFEDTNVRAGERYGYRVAVSGRYAAEVWIDVPVAAALAVIGAQPNPSRQLSLAFSLATGRAAKLEIFDLRGRRVVERSLEALGPGSHVLSIPEADRLSSGVYIARVTQDNASAIKRVTILR